jgi:Ca2+-binding EF-hand superfamily protein
MGDNYGDDLFEADKEEKISSMALPSINEQGSGHIAKKGSMTKEAYARQQDENRKMLSFEKHFKKMRKEAKKVLMELDADGTGSIEKKELPAVFEKLGLNLGHDELKKFIARFWADFDNDASGSLDFDEFYLFYEKVLADQHGIEDYVKETQKKLTKQVKREAKKCFSKYDADGSGYIDQNELKRLMSDLGFEKKGLSGRQIDDLVEHVLGAGDKDSDGTLDFHEFLRFYRKCLSTKAKRKEWKNRATERYAVQNPEMAFLSGI